MSSSAYVNRRGVLTALLSIPLLSACGDPRPAGPRPAGSPVPDDVHRQLDELERQHQARLGVYAVNTANGRVIAFRESERFAMCSTFKTYAAGALFHAHPLYGGFFEQRIRFTAADLVEYSPVTQNHVDTGMTVAELCEAAITMSDNTAGNQLLRLLGGPTELTRFARLIGDPMTRLDRWETELNSALRGDERDTTTPAAIAGGYRALVLGSVLGDAEREQLTHWLVANTTGGKRIRAGLPAGWRTGDKTGTGDFGTANDIAVTWNGSDGIVLAVLTDKFEQKAEADNALLADTAKVVIRMIV